MADTSDNSPCSGLNTGSFAPFSLVSMTRIFGCDQYVLSHHSAATGTDMTFGLVMPPKKLATASPPRLIVFLSGLTCTHTNVLEKSGIQRLAAHYNMAILAPDTSPRGLNLPHEHDDYDFGSGAGFYLDAVTPFYRDHYRMESYLMECLLPDVISTFSLAENQIALTGHSMGGHGAITLALKYPDRFKSVSAFAPIVAPSVCPWGEKAFTGYLGQDRSLWRQHDSVELIKSGHYFPEILIDQGSADPFLDENLKPDLLMKACQDTGNMSKITLRHHIGYDHSYYFIASLIKDHMVWANERLGK